MKKCNCGHTEFEIWYSDFNEIIKLRCIKCKTVYSGKSEIQDMPDADDNNSYEACYCECCSRLKTDVNWRDDTEQYECQECYQLYLDDVLMSED